MMYSGQMFLNCNAMRGWLLWKYLSWRLRIMIIISGNLVEMHFVNRCKSWAILYGYSLRSGTVVCTLQWPCTYKWWTSLVPAAGAHIAGRCTGTVPSRLFPHGSWGHGSWSSHHKHSCRDQVWISADSQE